MSIEATIMNANPATTKIFVIIGILLLLGVAIFVFFAGESENTHYEISYDSKEGVIAVTLEEALPDGQWTAYIYYETDTGGTRIITKDGTVTPSSDRMSFKITDDDDVLVNLDNHTYQIDLRSDSGHHDMHFQLTVSDHEFSMLENVAIWICIILAVGIVLFGVIRRIVRGY